MSKPIEDKAPEELTTSEIMLKIGAHYLVNGCNNCDFYKVAKTCDAIPINCAWMALHYYFDRLEKEEQNEDSD